MFGYVVPDPTKLNKDENERYRAVYCGLCHSLGENHGLAGRFTLTYDLAFLILVLTDVSGCGYTEGESFCPLRLHRKKILYNDITSYAADVNVLLAYYKLCDDVADDGDLTARAGKFLLHSEAHRIAGNRKELNKCICKSLREIENAEKNNVLDPDLLSGFFGDLMGHLFSDYFEKAKEELFAFGEALGKAIYMLDACADLQKDLKKERFNPLISWNSDLFPPVLEELMADVLRKYRMLPSGTDRAVIENVLLSGIWTVYHEKTSERKKSGVKRSV